MTCVDSVCTALSSASRKVTAMTLPRRACALLSFSREPTPACCVQNSLRSCLLVRPEIPLSGPPLIVYRVRLTVAARRKNSSPENLTHLHYNLLGKDSRKKPRRAVTAGGGQEVRPVQQQEQRWSNIPSITYADVGGMERAKERIRSVVQNRLHPERYAGVVQNGILLHGPQGTGKTFLAQATAGEFGVNYYYVRPTELIERWVGAPEANVREVFDRAAAHQPIVLFIDELDSL